MAIFIAMLNYQRVCHIHFQMVCQKLCQNSASGWGSLEEYNVLYLPVIKRGWLENQL